MAAVNGENYPERNYNFVYAMRAYDTTLGQYVYWRTADLDPTGEFYDGPGPLVDIVLHSEKGR